MPTSLAVALQLIEAQKASETLLCAGLDLYASHDDTALPFGLDMYGHFKDVEDYRERLHSGYEGLYGARLLNDGEDVPNVDLLAGVAGYFSTLVEILINDCGVYVFKPQAAFWEGLGEMGMIILAKICEKIRKLALAAGKECFLLLDAKRGDLFDTMLRYLQAYLTPVGEKLTTGISARYGFHSMTTHTWMGDDTLAPAIPFLQNGSGLTVVTRSSNPSGTTLQDALLSADVNVALNAKQEKYALIGDDIDVVAGIIGRQPSVQHMMMYRTSQFLRENGFPSDQLSPLFSVIGSTLKNDLTFRQILELGTALVPGFGKQGGTVLNALPLLMQTGEWAGFGAIFASSSAIGYAPWSHYQGDDDFSLEGLRRNVMLRVSEHRKQEEKDFAAEGIPYSCAA